MPLPVCEENPTCNDGVYMGIDAHRRMEKGAVPAVAHAAAIAYGLVFLHPFEDGNGRIHRFLIHNLLARHGFTPEGLMFPISAAMLKHRADYEASLEAFSRPLMSLVDYSLDDEGRMTVFYSWSSDIGDGLEDSAVHKDSPQAREAAMQMAINVCMFALTQP